MNIFVSPVSTTLPDLKDSGLAVLPYVYDGGGTVLDYPWRPHVHNVDAANKRYVFDPASCRAVALYLRDNSYRRAILDMEPRPENGGWSNANVAIAGQIVAEFASYGVALALWGLGTDALTGNFGATLAKSAPFVAPALYPYTKDVGQWLADRTQRTLRLRKESRKDAMLIVSPQASGHPLDYKPERSFIPADDFDKMLSLGEFYEEVDVWINNGVAPFSLPDEHMAVLKKRAKH